MSKVIFMNPFIPFFRINLKMKAREKNSMKGKNKSWIEF